MKKVIIIANEKKNEFSSKLPTIFHEIIDKPMIKKIVDNFKSIGFDDITTICEEDSASLIEVLSDSCNYVKTSSKKFDFKALKSLIKDEEGSVIITYGTIPLITQETYNKLLDDLKEYPMVILSSDRVDSKQDRILKTANNTVKVVIDYEDASSDEKSIKEVNMNVYAFNNKLLYKYLNEFDHDLEVYDVNDLLEKYKSDNHSVVSHKVADPMEAILIKSRRDLVRANKWEIDRINNFWLDNDVTILDSNSTIIGSDVKIGMDTIIHPNTKILGNSIIGENNTILDDTDIINSIIEDNNKIEKSKIFNTKIASDNYIGPWTNLRENVVIGNHNRVGTSVELKNTTIQDYNALAHNVYLGDTSIGNHCNIGWGVVTANYNGISKSKTVIGDNCFVGSSSTIIAPVYMGDKVLVAAGSVINEDIESGAMAIGRARQETKPEKGRKYIERVE